LLTLARADAGGAALPLQPIDLGNIVTSVVAGCDAAASAKGIRLETQLESGCPATLANETALRRLLLILLDNALKHTPAGGSIVVSTARTSEGVRLTVADTGTGIPPDAAPHIFERFYRVDQARVSGSGAGLGLAIAEKIAQAHNTAITVESKPGLGTRFALTLRPFAG